MDHAVRARPQRETSIAIPSDGKEGREGRGLGGRMRPTTALGPDTIRRRAMEKLLILAVVIGLSVFGMVLVRQDHRKARSSSPAGDSGSSGGSTGGSSGEAKPVPIVANGSAEVPQQVAGRAVPEPERARDRDSGAAQGPISAADDAKVVPPRAEIPLVQPTQPVPSINRAHVNGQGSGSGSSDGDGGDGGNALAALEKIVAVRQQHAGLVKRRFELRMKIARLRRGGQAAISAEQELSTVEASLRSSAATSPNSAKEPSPAPGGKMENGHDAQLYNATTAAALLAALDERFTGTHNTPRRLVLFSTLKSCAEPKIRYAQLDAVRSWVALPLPVAAEHSATYRRGAQPPAVTVYLFVGGSANASSSDNGGTAVPSSVEADEEACARWVAETINRDVRRKARVHRAGTSPAPPPLPVVVVPRAQTPRGPAGTVLFGSALRLATSMAMRVEEAWVRQLALAALTRTYPSARGDAVQQVDAWLRARPPARTMRRLLVGLINGDILLDPLAALALQQVQDTFTTAFVVGRRRGVDIPLARRMSFATGIAAERAGGGGSGTGPSKGSLLDFRRPGWETDPLFTAASADRADAEDFFIWTGDFFPPKEVSGAGAAGASGSMSGDGFTSLEDIPDFHIGRPAYDNWLLHTALHTRQPVLDATAVLVAYHQQHDYKHLGGASSTYWGRRESDENQALALARGGWRHGTLDFVPLSIRPTTTAAGAASGDGACAAAARALIANVTQVLQQPLRAGPAALGLVDDDDSAVSSDGDDDGAVDSPQRAAGAVGTTRVDTAQSYRHVAAGHHLAPISAVSQPERAQHLRRSELHAKHEGLQHREDDRPALAFTSPMHPPAWGCAPALRADWRPFEGIALGATREEAWEHYYGYVQWMPLGERGG